MKKFLKRHFYSASKQHGAKIHDGLNMEVLYYLLIWAGAIVNKYSEVKTLL